MRTSSSWRLLLLTLFLSISSYALQAAAPRTPLEFNAIVDGAPGHQVVLLKWFAHPEGDRPTVFDIYQASGETEVLANFTKIGSVEADPQHPFPEREYITYLVTDLQPGTYTFFVKAGNADGVSERTRIRVVVLKEAGATLEFVTEPVKTGIAGTAYRYQARATGAVNEAVTYSLVNGPDGMTINARTGVIEWTPRTAGRYEVKIRATIGANGVVTAEAFQSFVIEVKGRDDDPNRECATIVGKALLDDANGVINDGTITAFRRDSVRGDRDTAWREVWKPVATAPIQQSNFSLKLRAGDYKFLAEGKSFDREWYEDVVELGDAKVVTLACEGTVDLIMHLTAKPTPKFHVVEGRVTDAETGTGLRAVVTFEARTRDNIDRRWLSVRVETNAEGNFRVELPEGVDFIAFARAVNTRDGMNAGLYLTEWWQETHDATQATVITLTENKGGLNFTLDKRPTYENGFGGTLKIEATGEGTPGKVTAFLLIARGNDDERHRVPVASVETDSLGNYHFDNLTPGVYLVLGVPNERPYVPGWYVMGAAAAKSWKDATRIEVGEVMLTVQHDILLRTGKTERGRGHARGRVFDRRDSGIVVKDDHTEGTGGLAGALLIATDGEGTIVDFSMSANEGGYELTTLSAGTITLTVDRFGFEPGTQTIDIAEGGDVSADFGLAGTTTDVENPTDPVAAGYTLYPNPANTSATFSFPSIQGKANIRIVSMTGMVLATQSVDVLSGTSSVVLNTSNLPVGMTLVQISNGTHGATLPLVISR